MPETRLKRNRDDREGLGEPLRTEMRYWNKEKLGMKLNLWLETEFDGVFHQSPTFPRGVTGTS